MNIKIVCSFFLVIVGTVCLLSPPCIALEPDEILVVANRNAARSVGLAEYYMKRRGIPKENLIKLWVTDGEQCSRMDYNKKIAAPVRRYLEKNEFKGHIRCLVLMYGLPLKVAAPELTAEEKNEIEKLNKRKLEFKNNLKSVEEEDSTSPTDAATLKKELRETEKKITGFKRKTNMGASLDSEIALLLDEDYSLSWWVPNPYFLGFKGKNLSIKKENVLMVSRLDGPSSEIVKRIINDSIQAETEGLMGTGYFDARYPDPGNKKKFSDYGYGFYDWSIHRAAELLRKNDVIPVVVDDTQRLFEPGECPEAALYCGWYKLSHYVDAFTWQPGSVGYHIASSECATLKRKNSQVWCKMMLEKGVAATAGPVGEPYVQAFPVPEIFFGFLAEGILSLVECYIISTPYLSWKMVLVGDPLYRPFKRRNSPKKQEVRDGREVRDVQK